MYSGFSLKKRLIAIVMVFTLVLTALTCRLYYIQVISCKSLQSKGMDQWLRDLPLSAKRGSIYDRSGLLLASSYSVYDIYVRPALVEDALNESEIYAEILGLESEFVYSKLSDKSISENLLIKGIGKDVLNNLIKAELKSFSATENWKRHYNYDSLLSQILGFISTDGIGQSGVELYYDQILRGVDGISLVDGDAKGKELDNSQSHYIPAISGLNVELTIDFQIQSQVESILKNALAKNGAKSGSILVMNPQSGEILAISTQPSLNLNEIDRGDTENLFSLSRSFLISDTYEPGSTFKTLTAAIALDMGIVSVDTGFYCPGYMIVDGVRVNCHKKTGHGSQTLMSGFCNSCNCVFMQIASQIGVDKFYEYLSKFHLDSDLGIDFPGEAQSLIIPKQELTRNDFYRNGFGQSIAISGLQLMTSISAVATNGNLLVPYLVKRIYDDSGKTVFEANTKIIEQVVDNTVVLSIQALMKNVVEKGGGKASAVDGHTVGGKTGTAQKYENGVVSTGKYIASYICYSPIENPEYAVLVLFDEPKSSIYGNIVATPVAGEVLSAIYKLKGEINTNPETKSYVEVPDLRGMSITNAGSVLAGLNLYYVTEGEGPFVVYQSVSPGEKIEVGSSIMIRFEEV